MRVSTLLAALCLLLAPAIADARHCCRVKHPRTRHTVVCCRVATPPTTAMRPRQHENSQTYKADFEDREDTD